PNSARNLLDTCPPRRAFPVQNSGAQHSWDTTHFYLPAYCLSLIAYRSSVQLRRDDVQAAQHGHHVAELVPLDQVGEGGEEDERRRPGAGPVGGAAAVGDDVEPQLAVGRLGGAVDLVHRRLPLPVRHDELKVLDQALDRAVDRQLVGQHHLAVGVHVHRPRREVLDGRVDDLDTLPHLLHAHQVAGQAVALLGADHLEGALQVGVGQVRLVLAQVADDAAGPGDGPGAAEVDRLLAGQDADVLAALDEDAVAVEQADD